MIYSTKKIHELDNTITELNIDTTVDIDKLEVNKLLILNDKIEIIKDKYGNLESLLWLLIATKTVISLFKRDSKVVKILDNVIAALRFMKTFDKKMNNI